MIESILAAILAALLVLLVRARWNRPSLPLAVALAAILYPATEALVDFVHVAPLVGRPTTLQPLSQAQLARMPWNIVENNLLVPFLGLAAAAALGARDAALSYLAPLQRRARAWIPELSIGWAAIPVVVGGEALALAALQGPASFLQTADESALFANATLLHVLLLSLTPAVVEELYYRQFLQGALEELWPGNHAVWVALGVQAVLFSLAHASYTSLAHLLGPLVFGLGMGVLRTVGGLGACMVSHAAVNVFYFATDPGAGSTALLVASALLTLTGFVVLVLRRWAIRARFKAGPRPVRGRPGSQG